MRIAEDIVDDLSEDEGHIGSEGLPLTLALLQGVKMREKGDKGEKGEEWKSGGGVGCTCYMYMYMYIMKTERGRGRGRERMRRRGRYVYYMQRE